MWPLAVDTVTDEDLEALADWLRGSPHLTQGELVREFERTWATWNGSTDAVFVNSGSSANFMLVKALHDRLRRPLRVGVSAVTWPTNVTPSMMLGHQLVVLDVAKDTLGIDSDTAIAAMRDGLDVLFLTHLLGFCAATEPVLEEARRVGTIVIEDACEAHGATLGGRKVGTLGLGGTFSFYYGHHMSTIEGGMITTDDGDLADHLRLLRSHGLARESTRFESLASQNPDIDERFLFVTEGLNFRSTDLNAFLGLRQMTYLDERIKQRNGNLTHFLAHGPEWMFRGYRLDGVSSFALPVISAGPAAAGLAARLSEAGVESRPVVAGNLLRQPFLAQSGASAYGGSTPNADWVHDSGYYIGNGHHVTPELIDLLFESW